MSATHDPGNSPVSAIEKGVRFRAAVLTIHLVLTAGAYSGRAPNRCGPVRPRQSLPGE